MQKIKFTNHTELRKRQTIDCSKPILTDQSAKNYSDINNIMLQYSKTGLLPHVQEKVARYIDNTKIMPLEEAHELIQGARNLFMELPAQIRKLMDNDPSKMEAFISDKENYDVLLKYGIIEKVDVVKDLPKVKDLPLDPPSVDKKETK